MDNIYIHKNVMHGTFLESDGFELGYLPRYYPKPNLIDEILSKWKHLLNNKIITKSNNRINILLILQVEYRLRF